MKLKEFAKTRSGLEVSSYEFFGKKNQILVLGGVHGDEPEGVCLAMGLLSCLKKNYNFSFNLTLIPVFNPEGLLSHQRKNSKGVDLNRNLPTKDWSSHYEKEKYQPGPSKNSEPENKSLTKWIKEHKPQIIFSFHSWKPLINYNGDCKDVADIIAKRVSYIVKSDIGYPTPGSLGSYGVELKIPVLTYEVEKGLDFKAILRDHLDAVMQALKYLDQKWKS